MADDDDFRRFVVEHRRPLLRTALLMTGDSAPAEALVELVLLRTHRRWSRLAPGGGAAGYARRALVARATSRWRGLYRGEQVVEQLTDRGVDPRADRDEETLRALRELPPRTRVAVVLRLFDELPAAGTAELVRCSPGEAQALADAGAARLHELLGGPAADEQAVEDLLRDRLAAAAGRAVVSFRRDGDDDRAAADAVVDRARAQRRRRVLIGAAGLAAVLAVALVLPLTGLPSAAPSPADRTAPAADWSGPTRGSLAHDTRFLDQARRLPWPDPGGGVAQPTGSRRVLFAGDLAGHRWLLVAATVDGVLVGQWSTGDVGDTPAQLWTSSSAPLVPGQATSAMTADDRGSTLLVLTRPGDAVTVSSGLTVTAAGVVDRVWTPVRVHDGVAVTALSPIAGSVRYRIGRNGTQTVASPWVSSWFGDEPRAATAQTPRRPSGAPPTSSVVASAVTPVLQATGLREPDVAPVLLWTGTAAAATGEPAEVAVVAMTMPSGAVVVSSAMGGQADGSQVCGTSVHAAGPPPDAVVAVIGCAVHSASSEIVQQYLVVSAPGAAVVVLHDLAGRVVGQTTLPTGSGAVADPGAIGSVTVTGPGGAAVDVAVGGRDPLLEAWD